MGFALTALTKPAKTYAYSRAEGGYIPAGYRPISYDDIGKTFGTHLETVVYFDEDIFEAPNDNYTEVLFFGTSDFIGTEMVEWNESDCDVWGYYSSQWYNAWFVWNITESAGYWENRTDELPSGLTITSINNVSSNVLYVKDIGSWYSITWVENGGTNVSDIPFAQSLPNPLPTPTRTGYTFGGWYYDSELTSQAIAGAPISADTTLYAKWNDDGCLTCWGVGYWEGYEDGKIVGFDGGYAKAMDELGSQETGLFWLTSIATSIGSILALEIFPSISIGLLIFIPFAFGLLFWFLKLLKGGGD
jgi:uncharacterized repeat protein (TIGR02543 family)